MQERKKALERRDTKKRKRKEGKAAGKKKNKSENQVRNYNLWLLLLILYITNKTKHLVLLSAIIIICLYCIRKTEK